jgi:hypothetical protein
MIDGERRPFDRVRGPIDLARAERVVVLGPDASTRLFAHADPSGHQEIGIRKAIGARSRDVFAQFLAEATIVAMTSGLVGATAGIGLVRLVSAVMPEDSAWQSPPVLDPVTVVVFTSALVVVGIVSGLVPAVRAAQVPPAEALRAFQSDRPGALPGRPRRRGSDAAPCGGRRSSESREPPPRVRDGGSIVHRFGTRRNRGLGRSRGPCHGSR